MSFLSPCVLPIVPGYLSIITGLDIADLEDRESRNTWPVIRDTSLFVAGFGTVFVALGLSATSLGRLLVDHQALLTRTSGALVLAMGLFLLAGLFVHAPWLYQEKRFHPDLGRFGAAAPPVAGVAFGFGWTPCIGPVLTSILAIAATSDRAATGGLLLGVYSLGLGVPFLVTGVAFSRTATAFSWVKRHLTTLVAVSAVLLSVFGALLLFDRLRWLTGKLLRLLDAMGLDWLTTLG